MQERRDEFERLRPVDAEPDPAQRRARGLARGEVRDDERVALHPRGVGEILDLGLEILRSRFAACVLISTCLWIPARIVSQMLRVDPANSGNPQEDIRVFLTSLGPMSVTLLVISLVQVIASAFVAQFVQGGIEGRVTSVGDALRRAFGRLPGILVISLIVGIAGFIGFFLCFVPFLLVLWRLSLAPLIYVLEDVTIGESLRRAFQLTSGSFLRWFCVAIWMYAIAGSFSNSAGAGDLVQVRTWVIDLLHISSVAYEIGLVVVASIFLGTATAIQSSILTVYYVDCRVRRDAIDLHAWLARARAVLPARASGDASA